jgi:GNAT superfamily N-acetyltransferase
VKLRHPHPGDTGQLVALGRDMHAESWYRDFDYDEAKVQQLIDQVIHAPAMLGLVLEGDHGRIVGFLAAAETEHFFGFDRYAVDIALYVAPEHRGGPGFVRMVKAYEAWCRIRRVKEMHLGVSSGLDHPKTVRLFEKLGYTSTATASRKKCVWPD